jgi:hypothetical protein
MPRKTFLLGAALALLALAFAVTSCVLGPPHRVTDANAKRIQKGMTLSQVEVVFGGVAHSTEPTKGGLCRWCTREEIERHAECVRIWRDEGGEIEVWFNPFGKVIGTSFRSARPPQPSFLDRIRSWLGL